MSELSKWQQIIAKTYGEGDYGYLAELDQDTVEAMLRNDPDQFGDTLFVFLMIECSPREDCHDIADAHRRTNNAVTDVLSVVWALAEEMEDGVPVSVVIGD